MRKSRGGLSKSTSVLVERVLTRLGFDRVGDLYVFRDGALVHSLFPKRRRTGDSLRVYVALHVPELDALLSEADQSSAPGGWPPGLAQGSLKLAGTLEEATFAFNSDLKENLGRCVEEFLQTAREIDSLQSLITRFDDSEFWAYRYGATVFPCWPHNAIELAGLYVMSGQPLKALGVVSTALEDPETEIDDRRELEALRSRIVSKG